MSSTDALAITNQALLLLGEAPIDSFDGGATPQVAAAASYQPVVDALLASHPWWWNRRIVPLARLSAPPSPSTGFDSAYQLPGLVFRAVVPFVDSRPVEQWGLAGDQLYIDATATSAVELEFHTRVDEQRFSPEFRQAVVSALARELCLPITDNEARWKAMVALSDQQLRKARHTNATEKPATRLPTGGLQRRMRR